MEAEQLGIIAEIYENDTQPLLLSEENANLLITTITSVVRKIADDFPDELPDILFPETTGRLLKRAILTLLTTVAQQRSKPAPKGYAFITASWIKDEYLGTYYTLEDDAIQQHVSVETYVQDRRNIRKDDIRAYARESVSHVQALRTQQRKEAEVINCERENERRNTPLIVVDDAISHRMATILQIRDAFGDIDLPMYVLCAVFPVLQPDPTLPKNVFAAHSSSLYPHDNPFYSLPKSIYYLVTGAKKQINEYGVTLHELSTSEPELTERYQRQFAEEMHQITTRAAEVLGLTVE